MDLMEIDCDDGRWMELAQDRVQWWALVLTVLNLCVPLPELVCNIDRLLDVINLPVQLPQSRNYLR
jgi:hypothetical protein